MVVSQLRLRNFRNYAAQQIELPRGLVALTGDNGQGKTNLLEAICVLATTKSPLVERDRELMRWGARETRLEAEIELSRGTYAAATAAPTETRLLEYGWKLEGNALSREMRAGGVPQSALAGWLGQMQVVAFFPHDLTIITGEPGERRRFLNLELGKSRPAHFADAARYKRALQQRNALLKHLLEARFRGRGSLGNAAEGLGTLGEWNRQIISYGARILAQRAQFLRELAPLLDETHRALSGRDETFSVVYSAGVSAEKNDAGEYSQEGDERVEKWSALFQSALERDHETDARRGGTQSGPHRDDLVFRLGDMDLRRYGSQGQQRLAVLALKVALARWVEKVTGESPILLLDDALSELDATRRKRLLEMAAGFSQSVLTAADEKLLEGAAPYHLQVESGRVISTSSEKVDLINEVESAVSAP